MCYCYVLECSNGQYYIGSARNIVTRLKDHKNGRVKFTKNKRPVKLRFVKRFDGYKNAYQFEMRIKSWKKRLSVERTFNKSDNIYKKHCGVV